MSVTFTQIPATKLVSVKNFIPFTTSSTVSTNENFQFRYNFKNYTVATVFSLDQTPNITGYGNVDASYIIDSQLYNTFNPNITTWTGNSGLCYQFRVDAQEIWTSGSTTLTGATGSTLIYTAIDSAETPSIDYHMTTEGSSDKYFLTKYRSTSVINNMKKFTTSDQGSISTLNISASTYESLPLDYRLVTYDVHGGVRTFGLGTNPYYGNSANTFRDLDHTNNFVQSLPYCPKNLIDANWYYLQYNLPSGYTGYRAWGYENDVDGTTHTITDGTYSGTTNNYPYIISCVTGEDSKAPLTPPTNTINAISYYKVFCYIDIKYISEQQYVALDCCTRFPGITFAFKNTFGVYDFYRFTKVYTLEDVIARDEYNKYPYKFSTNKYERPTYGRERTTNYVDVVNKYVSYTDWICENDIPLLRDLLRSSDVYARIGTATDYVPIIITTDSYQVKDTQQKERMYQFQITFENANKIITN